VEQIIQHSQQEIDARISAQVAKIKVKFVESLEERIVVLDGLLQPLESPDHAAQARKQIGMLVHKIHGLAGLAGLSRVGSLASQLENFIDKLNGQGASSQDTFVAELLHELLDEMESACADA
jgi:HPt (histidine-containing phosphotransfer) domain-containing protein